MRGVLIERLRARAPEIEESILAKGQDFEPPLDADPEGLAILRALASSSVDVISVVIEQGDSWLPTLSPAGAEQVRYMARNGVALDEVIRGYYVITSRLVELLASEAADLPAGVLPRAMGILGEHADSLMGAIAAEYETEIARLDRSPAKRIAERVEKLLAGKPAGTTGLGYDLDAWHLGVIVTGAKAELVTKSLAERLGCQLLLLPRGAGSAWAWLGAKRAIPFAKLERFVLSSVDESVSVAVGEAREGIDGWRLTHREAQTALAVMLRQPQRLVRGSDVVLLAAAIRDETMRRSLVDRYLGPLDEHRDARTLRETLRIYFSLDCNAASAAAALGVNRHTVQRRLRKVETMIGRSLDTCRAEMDVALRIEQLEQLDLSH